jgi:hypothetical protein
MLGLLRFTFWSRCVLSLLLLAANIGAPFRMATTGRVLLESLRQNPATGLVVRVRSVSPSGVSQGFRAVVGLATGDPDEADPGANSHVFSAFLPSLTDPLPHRPGAGPIARPNPFLRC